MRWCTEALLLAGSLASAIASPQLVNPSDLPSTCDNIKLVAHAQRSESSGLQVDIENWHLSGAGADGDDPQSLALSRPGGNGTGAAISFYLDPAAKTLVSRRLSDGVVRELVLDAGDSGPPQLSSDRGRGRLRPSIEWKLDAPRLSADGVLFYACQTASGSADGSLGLYYRQQDSQEPSDSCVGVTLLSSRAEGPFHGDASLLLCCEDAKDGKCIN